MFTAHWSGHNCQFKTPGIFPRVPFIEWSRGHWQAYGNLWRVGMLSPWCGVISLGGRVTPFSGYYLEMVSTKACMTWGAWPSGCCGWSAGRSCGWVGGVVEKRSPSNVIFHQMENLRRGLTDAWPIQEYRQWRYSGLALESSRLNGLIGWLVVGWVWLWEEEALKCYIPSDRKFEAGLVD